MTEDVDTNPLVNTMDEQGDFNLGDEYLEIPLLSNGIYNANINLVEYDLEKSCLTWEARLENNGGNCVILGPAGIFVTDPKQQVDDQILFLHNWLPRKGDKQKFGEKNGKTSKKSKHEGKVQMLGNFCKHMNIPFTIFNSPTAIKAYVDSLEWKDMKVKIKTEIEMSDKYGNKSVIAKMVPASANLV